MQQEMFISGGVPNPPNVQFRESIMSLEQAMLKSELRIPVPPVKHIFAPGVYGREMTIPVGVTIVGRIHRYAHINVISKGKIAVATEFGTEILVAPTTFVSLPGTKRAVTAIEETIWLTIHPTDEIDPDVIVEQSTFPSYEALLEHKQ